jgi:hypothetical protein
MHVAGKEGGKNCGTASILRPAGHQRLFGCHKHTLQSAHLNVAVFAAATIASPQTREEKERAITMHPRHFRTMLLATTGALAAVAATAIPKRASALGGIETESVNLYNDAGCTGASNLGYSNSSADGFYSNMVAAPNDVDFYQYVQWKDTNVYDSDFLDPDLSGAPCSTYLCNDTNNFDQYGNSISFFQGHGAGATSTSTVCNASNYTTQCSSANAPSGYTVGLSGYGSCALSPMSESAAGSGNGFCRYTQANTINPTVDTCGYVQTNHNHAQIGYMALGENPITGGWRGAGTNGGIALAIFHISFGTTTFFPLSNWGSAFAGLQLYAGMMVSYDDVCDASQFGALVSQPYASNPYGEVAEAYVNALGLNNADGSGCTGSGSVVGGFNGCGCNTIISVGVGDGGTKSTLYGDWYDLVAVESNASGTGYWYYDAECNYNVSAYPWYGGD